MALSAWEYEVARRTLYGEARGQKMDELVAIAWVIRNRAHAPDVSWWGDSIADVCMQPSQFSCWNHYDPNRKRLLNAPDTDPDLIRCGEAVRAVFDYGMKDPTGGATHYHTVRDPGRKVAPVWPPVWTRKMKRTATIGAHVFLREG